MDAFGAAIKIWIDKGKDARRRARNAAQKPGATRKIEDKREKAPKHRKPLKEDV